MKAIRCLTLLERKFYKIFTFHTYGQCKGIARTKEKQKKMAENKSTISFMQKWLRRRLFFFFLSQRRTYAKHLCLIFLLLLTIIKNGRLYELKDSYFETLSWSRYGFSLLNASHWRLNNITNIMQSRYVYSVHSVHSVHCCVNSIDDNVPA